MKKRITLALAATVLIGAVGYGATVAFAQSKEGSTHPMIQAFAQRFGLNEDEVKEVFDEVHADQFALIRESKEEGLNQAVEDGVITEEQKQALLDKFEEKKEHKGDHKVEMQTWFEEQGIDPEALREYWGYGHKGFGHYSKFGRFGKVDTN